MTRQNPTEAETLMESVVLESLRHSDASASVLPRSTSDKPDLAFRFEEQIIACECVQVPPAEVFQWVHRRIESLSDGPYCHAVVWAEEPHSWVNEAIKSKTPKITEYQDAIAADAVWLLIHTPIVDTQIFVRGDFPWEAQMLRYGACRDRHDFDRILFWEPRSALQEIYRPGQSTPPVSFDFTDGYPSRAFVGYGRFPFTTTREGEPPKTYTFDAMSPRIIKVPPVDPEFAKHEPRFRERSYKVTIVAYSDHADTSIETIWADDTNRNA